MTTLAPVPLARVRTLLTVLLVATAAAVAIISVSGLIRFATLAALPMPTVWPVVLDLAAAVTAVTAWYAQGLGHRAFTVRAFTLGLVAASATAQMSVTEPVTTGPTWLWVASVAGHGAPPAVLYGLLEAVLWARRLAPVPVAPAVPVPVTVTAPAPPSVTAAPAVTRPVAPRRKTAPAKPVGRAVTTDEELVAKAHQLATRRAVQPTELAVRVLRQELSIGHPRAQALAELLRTRPALKVVPADEAQA